MRFPLRCSGLEVSVSAMSLVAESLVEVGVSDKSLVDASDMGGACKTCWLGGESPAPDLFLPSLTKNPRMSSSV